MDTITIRYRHYTGIGFFLLVLCGGAGYVLEQHSYLYLGIFMCLLFCVLGTRKEIFSNRGIDHIFLGMKRYTPWSQVIQIGIMTTSYHHSAGPHLLVTLTGGKKKTPTMGFSDWLNGNQNAFYVPCDEALRELVLRHYGPLDFEPLR